MSQELLLSPKKIIRNPFESTADCIDVLYAQAQSKVSALNKYQTFSSITMKGNKSILCLIMFEEISNNLLVKVT